MELVGMEVKKTFLGFGTFSGTVQSYDASAGYFKILYEDGDSEEVDHEEIASILESMGVTSPLPLDQPRRTNRGRPPKKRLRMEPDRMATSAPGSDRVEGEVNETLAVENGSSRVLEDIQANGGSLEENSVKMEEPGEENCNGEVEMEKRGDEKRRKRKSLPNPEMPLRRSARKVRASHLTTPDSAPVWHPRREGAKLESRFDSVKIENVSVSEDADLGGNRCVSVWKDSEKPALPRSSTDLDLDGLNVFDLFSVYTCLRSFSRLLFLSPFTLEAFLAALRCKHANLLIDSIHYSILQALKPHLEFLSEEGSESAMNCLRSLDWDILDLVTWPVFVAEYLLIHASRVKLSFKVSQLKILDGEYYELPAGLKLDILCFLCDDVIEVEPIRSELARRMVGSDVNGDANGNVEKKRKPSIITDLGSSLAEEVLDEIDDGNSDECCLCGMDGNLICCDGCPAAFHSRCVGVAKELLPEGEWYCPECVVKKGDGLVKLSKPFRGAENLGIDPHGRLYFGTCDRLLVSSSCESDASFHYYNKHDLDSVIIVLKSSYASYQSIINAISMYWGIHPNGDYVNCDHIKRESLDGQLQSEPTLPSNQGTFSVGTSENKAVRTSASEEQFGAKSSETASLLCLKPSHQFGGMHCPFACSEPFDEMVHATSCVQNSWLTGTDCAMNFDAPADGIIASSNAELATGTGKLIELTGLSFTLLASDRTNAGASHLHSDFNSYQNYYIHGRIASSIHEALIHKFSKNSGNESIKSDQDIRSAQLKTISEKSIKCSWYIYQKLFTDTQKENCDWCISCKTPSDSDCLFKVAYDKSLEGFIDKNLESGRNGTVGLHFETNKKSHIAFAIHHLLLIEQRVRGLLSGPWEKPHYSDSWREAVCKASDVASLKPLLLMLELNLRRVALSVDWSKPVDFPCTIGSGSILISTPVRASSNIAASKKLAKKIMSGDENSLISHSAKSSGIYWWRGGKVSRQVFYWKMLPRSLASKGARQAGCRKIPNISYPDGSEFAKRSKFVAWRAAVEMSQSVAQLIYQVEEFDTNIKWTELSETRFFPQSASKKSTWSLKKVTVRRKCIEGTVVKYLLDFGRKVTVPAIVAKHGVFIEECSNGRKSYWLNETLVPLNLLKSFEERKIARLMKKSDLGTYPENGRICELKKRSRSEGFSYLISRVQKFETQLCGHCNKDVLVREAVNCQFCDGFFHRKHFRVPKGATATTYTCCRCKDENSVKVKPHGRKGVLKKRKHLKAKKSQDIIKKSKRLLVKSNKMATQATPIKGKLVLAKSNKKSKLVKDKKEVSGRMRDSRGKFLKKSENLKEGNLKRESPKNSESELNWRKRGKRGKARKKKSGKLKNGNVKDKSPISSENGISSHKRKRSVMHYSYWLNGLLWTQKPVNEHQKHFRERKVLLPLQHSEDPSLRPVCCLCREEFNSRAIYIGCEICGDWFHGDVFRLTLENINNVVGFKCHSCCMRSKPICPFSENVSLDEAQLDGQCNVGVDSLGIEHQIDEEKLHDGSNENYSPVVDKEYHLEKNQSENVLTNSVEEVMWNPISISGRNVDTNYQNDELDNANHLDGERRDDIQIHSKVVPVLYPRDVTTNGSIIRSLEHVEASITSTKDGNETQVGVASHKMGKDFYGKRDVPDSFLSGTLGDSIISHPPTILHAQNVDDIGGLKS